MSVKVLYRDDPERRKREAVLTDEGCAWLAARDAEIAKLREQRPK